MAFQTPPEGLLTENQQKALSQIISFKSLFTRPSTILATISGDLPDSWACIKKFSRAFFGAFISLFVHATLVIKKRFKKLSFYFPGRI